MASQLDRIEAKLDQLLAGDERLISVPEAMEMLGVNSLTAFKRAKKKLGLRFVVRGRYRRADIAAAIQRATLCLLVIAGLGFAMSGCAGAPDSRITAAIAEARAAIVQAKGAIAQAHH